MTSDPSSEIPADRHKLTRENRKKAGVASVLLQLPPALVQIIDQERGTRPRTELVMEWIRSRAGLKTAVSSPLRRGRPRKATASPATQELSPTPPPADAVEPVSLQVADWAALLKSVPDPRRLLKSVSKKRRCWRQERKDGLVDLRWEAVDQDRRSAYIRKLGAKKTGVQSAITHVWWILSRERAEQFIEHFHLAVVPSSDGFGPDVGSHAVDVVQCAPAPGTLLEARLDFTAALAKAKRDVAAAMGLTEWLQHCRKSDFYWYWVEADFGGLSTGTLVSEPLLEEELSSALDCEEWKGGKPRYVHRQATPAQCEAWADVPLQGQETPSSLVEPRPLPTCPRHRIGVVFMPYLESKAAGRAPLVLRSDWKAAVKRAKRFGTTTELLPPPAAKPVLPINPARVPGWNTAARGGFMLYPHQREAVHFALKHDLHCLIGDEMGLGKTASAVAVSHAARLKRMLVVCPLTAVGVWEQEIASWSASDQPTPAITVVTATDKAPVIPNAGWVLITYETLAGRRERIKVTGEDQANALSAFLATVFGHGPNSKDGVWKVTEAWMPGTNADDTGSREYTFAFRVMPEAAMALRGRLTHERGLWLNDRLHQGLERVARRLERPVVTALQTWNAELVIVDEAHRVKDPNARRTRAVREACEGRRALLLTGTPLRNHAEEGKALLEIISPESARGAVRKRGENITEVVKVLFAWHMIRRLKKDVRKELPPKVRQKILVPVGAAELKEYAAVMSEAEDCYARIWAQTGSETKARKVAMGLWTSAKRLLGSAKLNTGLPLEYIRGVVEEKGYAIVFAHHHEVLSGLQQQLQAAGVSVERIDGRVKPDARKEIIRRFQAGEIQVFLGGLMAAGTAITLTKAETVIFVELDWVPADLVQAEDRGHRVGQTAAKYHIIHLVARITPPPKPQPPTPLSQQLRDDCTHYEGTGFLSPELDNASAGSMIDEERSLHELELADRLRHIENIDAHIISALNEKVQHIAEVLNERSSKVVADRASRSGLDFLARATKERVLHRRQEKATGEEA